MKLRVLGLRLLALLPAVQKRVALAVRVPPTLHVETHPGPWALVQHGETTLDLAGSPDGIGMLLLEDRSKPFLSAGRVTFHFVCSVEEIGDHLLVRDFGKSAWLLRRSTRVQTVVGVEQLLANIDANLRPLA